MHIMLGTSITKPIRSKGPLDVDILTMLLLVNLSVLLLMKAAGLSIKQFNERRIIEKAEFTAEYQRLIFLQ